MPRAATKARPPTPSGAAAARPADATAQEADEGSVRNAKTPVTYSRKNPAASEAAAAAVTGTHYQNNLSMQGTLLMKPLAPCVHITAFHAALY